MIENWAELTADRIVGEGPFRIGRFLPLGATDMGKTILLNALADVAGQDMAVGVIERWGQEKARATIRARQLDTRRARCLTIGNARIDTPFGWS